MPYAIRHYLAALLAVVLCGCAAQPATFEPVPREALSGSLGMLSSGGIYYVEFDTFKTWLLEGGEAAQNRALHDDRTVEGALLPQRMEMLWSADPWRVKDLAYQILIDDRAIAITSGDNYAKRDELIATYLDAHLAGHVR